MRFVTRFASRAHAGRELAPLVAEATRPPTVVLGVPHGGIVTAAPIADAISAPLCSAWVRKITSSREPDVVLGAVDLDGDTTLAVEIVRAEGLSSEQVAELSWHAHRRLLHEWERAPGLDATSLLPGATAVIVDDSLCTGLSLRAAMRWARRQGADRIVLAVPVVDSRIWPHLAHDADEAICLDRRGDEPIARSDVYEDYHLPSEAEVALLLQAGIPAGTSSTAPLSE
jgi:putative phosphoribosyl transferase